MEILCAMQALGFLKPLKASSAVEAVYDFLEPVVPFAKVDRIFSEDIELVKSKIRDNSIALTLKKSVGDLEW